MIYFTSDLHFCHDREFVYKPRGFNNVDEMNNEIVRRWNSVVAKDDDVYVLGDLMLNDNEKALKLLKTLNGKLHIVFGNHDTPTRIKLYKELPNVVETGYAIFLRHKNMNYFMTHYPCITGNLQKGDITQMTVNLFGHTHSKELFWEGLPYMYNVALDAHNCFPVLENVVINNMREQMAKAKKERSRFSWIKKLFKK